MFYLGKLGARLFGQGKYHVAVFQLSGVLRGIPFQGHTWVELERLESSSELFLRCQQALALVTGCGWIVSVQ